MNNISKYYQVKNILNSTLRRKQCVSDLNGGKSLPKVTLPQQVCKWNEQRFKKFNQVILVIMELKSSISRDRSGTNRLTRKERVDYSDL